MKSLEYERVMQIVDAAMDAAPEERDAIIRREAAGDDELRAEVERLLAQDKPESRFLEESPLNALPFSADEEDSLIGKQIGSYLITEEIGRGGMGAVYKAVRADDQYQTEVAIKLIKRGMDTDFVLRRFRNERQILANLNHPNIARLLDGGTTAEGLPYFVMEYIKGKSIIKYCDSLKLSTVDRLELFRKVCSALSYAHRNLVVHRDLKPSNILVTGDGTPKLLDFGIAKLFHGEGDDLATALTATEFRAMTPEYASPEQIRGEPITTVSDVYSLGVLLYELLTGHRPYRFKNRRAEEVARVISDVAPERPSTAINRHGEGTATDQPPMTPASVSEVREGTAEKLKRRLQGDIDNIVLKALHKEPQRRYASVEQLSEDLRRHLEGLPVEARKDTFVYRAQKFVQRHKAGVTAASLIVLAMVAGMAATLWQARVARAERARAERRFNDVRLLTNSFMFEIHDEIDKGPLKAKELVVKKALAYLDSLSKEAGNDPGLQRELATAYMRIGAIQGAGLLSHLNDTKGALESNRKAIAIRESLVALQPNSLEVRHELAVSYNDTAELISVLLNKPAESVDYYRKAQALLEPLVAANPANREFRRSLASDSHGYANALNNLTEGGPENRAMALDRYRRAVTLYEELEKEDPTDRDVRRRLSATYGSLGIRMSIEGKSTDALDYFRKSLAKKTELIAEDKNNISYRRESAVLYSNIGSELRKTGDRAGSLDHARKALTIYEELLALDKNDANALKDLAIGHRNLGQVQGDAGENIGAAQSYQKAIAIFEDLIQKNSANAYNRRQLALSYLRFSALLSNTSDPAGAAKYARNAVASLEELIKADAQSVGVLRVLADSYSQLGKSEVLLAAKTGGKDRMRDACAWYQKSFDVWNGMKTKGTLSGAEKNRPDEVAAEIARCGGTGSH